MLAENSDLKAEGSTTDEAEAGLAAAASLFRGLGDPSRLAIVEHLLLGQHNVRELTEHLGLAQSTVRRICGVCSTAAWWPCGPWGVRRCTR